MKKVLVLIAATCAVLLSGGCATAPAFGVAADRVEVVDYRKMAIIERYAMRSGMQVIWLHQPTKIVDKVASGS